tara:strand:- start:43 stop:504 length:462 start_codon:yes stop_codon:yes gene_type:complete
MTTKIPFGGSEAQIQKAAADGAISSADTYKGFINAIKGTPHYTQGSNTTKTSSLFDQLSGLDKDQVGQLKGIFGSPRPKFEMNLEAIRNMLKETFGNPWTPWGYGWGGNNSNAVRINKSAASKTGSSYAGNKSSFNREGSRLNTQGTPWKSTL